MSLLPARPAASQSGACTEHRDSPGMEVRGRDSVLPSSASSSLSACTLGMCLKPHRIDSTRSSCRPCWDFLLLPHLHPRPLSSVYPSVSLCFSLSPSDILFLSPLFLSVPAPSQYTYTAHTTTAVLCLTLYHSLRNLS